MGDCLLLPLRYGHACAPNPCTESMPETTETSNAMMRYSKSLTPSPPVAIFIRMVSLKELPKCLYNMEKVHIFTSGERID